MQLGYGFIKDFTHKKCRFPSYLKYKVQNSTIVCLCFALVCSASFTDVDSRCRMFHIKLMRAARWRGGNEVLAHMFISAPRLICFFHNSRWLDQAEQQPLQKSPSVRLCRVYPVLILRWVFSWIIFELNKVNNGKSWRCQFILTPFWLEKKSPSRAVHNSCRRMGSGMSASMHVIDCSHWNLRWNCTQNRTMDYDWLGMGSERHLTTELIETRLTEDILLDGTGEAGKKRWERTYPKTVEKISHNTHTNLMKAFG